MPLCLPVTVRAETTSNLGTTVMRSEGIKGQHWRSYLLPASDLQARLFKLFFFLNIFFNSACLNLVSHTVVALRNACVLLLLLYFFPPSLLFWTCVILVFCFSRNNKTGQCY